MRTNNIGPLYEADQLAINKKQIREGVCSYLFPSFINNMKKKKNYKRNATALSRHPLNTKSTKIIEEKKEE